VTNAQEFMKIQKEFGSFSNYIWGFVDGKPVQNSVVDYKKAPPTTEISDALSKDLKKRGFKFVGSTVIYAHMQATGMINDHEVDCFRYTEV
jgi:DNA-3-methyladenine glycosylase I